MGYLFYETEQWTYHVGSVLGSRKLVGKMFIMSFSEIINKNTFFSTMGLCGLNFWTRLPQFTSSLSSPWDCPQDSDSQAVKLRTSLLEIGRKTTSFLGSSLSFHLPCGACSKNASTTASSSWVLRKWMTGPHGRYWNSEMTSHCCREPLAGELLWGRSRVRG